MIHTPSFAHVALCTLLVSSSSSCAAPGANGDGASAERRASAAPAQSAAPRASVVATTTAASSAAPTASASAVAAPATTVRLEDAPKLVGDDGTPLPQTEDRPTITSAAFEARMQLLVRAIAADDPAIAAPVFFPKVAYEQVKDIKKPGADWEHRLMKAFARDIHAYHDKLGADAASATYAGLDVDDKRVKWMDRGKEGNKLGYFRVTRNKLRIAVGGEERKLELTSLISWRGEWFVVHLSGFK